MYLYNYNDSVENQIVVLAADKQGFTDVNTDEHITFLNTSLRISDTRRVDTYNNNYFRVSEFSGNCSSLILSNIQNKSSEYKERALNVAIEICEKMRYAALFISGTGEEFKYWAINHGFEIVINELYNPHSSNNNFFACLRIEYE